MKHIFGTGILFILAIAGHVLEAVPKSKVFQMEGVGSIYIETDQRVNILK